MKANVHAERTMFGKTTGRYVAEIAGFEAIGTSRDEALLILSDKLNDLNRHDMTKRYLVTIKGNVFSLYHYFGGWGYDIIRTGVAGAVSSSACMMGNISFVDAYAKMKSHWEQMNEDEAKELNAVAA